MNNIYKVSNPKIVYNNFINYLKKNKLNVKDYQIYISNRKNKKYMIYDFKNDKIINHFGDLRYTDYTYHKDDKRRLNYLNRAKSIRGNWKNNIFSPNNLSIFLLW